MTGRIKVLSSGSASGFITAEDGLNVHFDASSVLAYDAACLAVGQMVTFDLRGGNSPEAVNVYVQRSSHVAHADGGRQESMRIRYMGFDQREGVRAYRFERRSPGEETETFIVNTDLALFTKHHIAIQEGPALCLHVLVAEREAAATPGLKLQCSLTDKDMLAHLASRPVPGPKRYPKRVPRASAAAPHAF